MMNEELSANGFDFYFDFEPYKIGGKDAFEVFVTRYYDRTQGDGSTRLHDNPIDEPHKARGKTKREAWEKSAASAKAWAEAQPANRG